MINSTGQPKVHGPGHTSESLQEYTQEPGSPSNLLHAQHPQQQQRRQPVPSPSTAAAAGASTQLYCRVQLRGTKWVVFTDDVVILKSGFFLQHGVVGEGG